MDYTYAIARRFPAGHSLDGHPRCKHNHGHDWKIELTISGSPYFRERDSEANIHARLDEFVGEIRGKNLNSLNPAGTADCLGVALWAWERLVMSIPGLDAIEVSTSEERSKVSL